MNQCKDNTSKYDMNKWMMLCTNVKRESLETSGANANNKICFEVRAPSSTSPPSPRRISNPLSEYRTPLSTLQCHRGNTTTIHLYWRGIRPVANITNTITSTEEGSKPIPLRSTSTKEGYNKSKGVYNLEATTTSNNLSFPQNKILIE